jgi:hypothetical protein
MRTFSFAFGLAAIAACASPPPAPPTTPVAATDAGASTSTESASSSGTRKRTRTAASAPPARDGTKPKNGRPLNPKDPLGRTVFVRADDHCFVEVPSKDKPARTDEGARTAKRETEDVDCPPEANDPAWDHCGAQIVADEPGTKCFCVTGAGHPRPMPNPTPCPSSRK